jgi:hypothetical protein
MNIQQAAVQYLEQIFTSSPGVKALLLDRDTFDIISVTMTRTELYSHEVVLIEQLSVRVDKDKDPSLAAINCVCLLRPTQENAELLARELSSPTFQKYQLFFTGPIEQRELQTIARADSKDIVGLVQEVFLDFLPLHGRLFSLDIADVSDIRGDRPDNLTARIAEGLFAALCALRSRPLIRYDTTSRACEGVASHLSRLATSYHSEFFSNERDPVILVLVVDRRIDPVTPLMHLFYYGSCLHDLLGISHNVVHVGDHEHILDERIDRESARYFPAYMQDAGDWIAERARRHNERLAGAQRLGESGGGLEELAGRVQDALVNHSEPLFVQNHRDLYQAVFNEITRQGLFDVAQIEQMIVTGGGDIDLVLRTIRLPTVSPANALRVALLAALRSEEKPERIEALRRALSEKATWGNGELSYFETLCRIAGRSRRGEYGEIFSKGGLLNFVAGLRELKSNEGQFEKYKSPLSGIISAVKDGRLSETAFRVPDDRRPKGTIRRVLVFYVGGATYEDFRIATAASTDGWEVVVGGTTVHNAASFLENEVRPFIGLAA